MINSGCVADFAFLDVEMPGRNGIYAGDELKKQNPRSKIFIVTSYPDYLDEAMGFAVFRYLSKPIDKNRLFRSLKEALYQYEMDKRVITIEASEGIYTIFSDDIVCVESTGRNVTVFTRERDINSVENMAYWQENLHFPCFFQTYRNYIVNMKYISFFNKSIVYLKYSGKKKEAYLAKRKYTEFKNRYFLFLENTK